MASIELAGARVLVVGGSGVLGSAIAGEMSRHGAVVLLSGRDQARLEKTAAAIGDGAGAVRADLADPLAPAQLVAAATQLLGGIDGVVNAAGSVAFGSFDDLDDATLDGLVAANFTGPLKVIREAVKAMQGGFVVSISGVVAEVPRSGMAAYSGVKSALSAATRAAGRELRRRGIHVLDARPPHTETGLADRPISGNAPPLPKGLDPGDVAGTIVAGLIAGKGELAAADFAAS